MGNFEDTHKLFLMLLRKLCSSGPFTWDGVTQANSGFVSLLWAAVCQLSSKTSFLSTEVLIDSHSLIN